MLQYKKLTSDYRLNLPIGLKVCTFSQKKSGRTVIRFVGASAKFGTCTVVSVNGTLVEDKMRRFKDE
jgi:hypothetical protein